MVVKKDEWWWCRNQALLDISASLVSSYVSIIDEFLPPSEFCSIRDEVLAANQNGFLSMEGMIGGGRRGRDLKVKDKTIRNDFYGFFEENKWTNCNTISRLLDKVNTIVCEMRDQTQNEFIISELQHITTRSNAMITCYPGNGSFYSQHIDNPIRNGRKLTTIFYLNDEYIGGELVISPNYDSYINTYNTMTSKTLLSNIYGYNLNDKTTIIEENSIKIAPISNRLVIFWSDFRCPHNVLPTITMRYAITIWFIDGIERDDSKRLDNLQQDDSSTSSLIDNSSLLSFNNNKFNNDNNNSPSNINNSPSSINNSPSNINNLIHDINNNSESTSIKECEITQTLNQPYLLSNNIISNNMDTKNNNIIHILKFQFRNEISYKSTILNYNSNTSTILLHSANQLFDDIYVNISNNNNNNNNNNNKIQAKYSKKKQILTITI